MILHDQPYFEWLISQIGIPRPINDSFDELFLRLHKAEFIWMISGDDNRAQDARDLRAEYQNQFFSAFSRFVFNDHISILEILIVLSRTLEFVAGGDRHEWAWRLIENLGLDKYSDPLHNNKSIELDSILDNLTWRTYDRDGHGGFFPLSHSKEDQTKVELWYQLNAYINEINAIES